MSKTVYLTKDIIINSYQTKYQQNYEERKEFKFIILLLDAFSNVKISSSFPDGLLSCNFDLMLDIFAEWDYEEMTDSEISKLAEFIINHVSQYQDAIDDLIYAFSTYSSTEVLKKLTHSVELMANKYNVKNKDDILKSLRRED